MKDLQFAVFRLLKVGQRVRLNKRARLSVGERHRIGRNATVTAVEENNFLGCAGVELKWDHDGVSYFMPRHTISRIPRTPRKPRKPRKP